MSSRVGRKPIDLPAGVNVKINAQEVTVKGPKGELHQPLPAEVMMEQEGNVVKVLPKKGAVNGDAIAGTIRAILANHVKGVSEGFTRKLLLVGVGYRAQLGKSKEGKQVLNLTLGLSHPVVYLVPNGITLTSATVTEIEVAGLDKQLVGQAAANIRGICKGLREPEPYKGKGIRYADEVIVLKETKKK